MRVACLRLIPYIQAELRKYGANPHTLQTDEFKKAFIRPAIAQAAAADRANRAWEGAAKVYSNKYTFETALLNLYWKDVCEGFLQ